MTNDQDKIQQLVGKLDSLLKKQDDFSREISLLKNEIDQLKTPAEKQDKQQEEIKLDRVVKDQDFEIKEEKKVSIVEQKQEEWPKLKPQSQKKEKKPEAPKGKSDLEKFIGENLINKIGIAITIIGVAIGAKYSIEHELISPLTRIILGYLAGLGLLGFGMKLKKKYQNYSAVLVSGAMAIMYFITYSAYSFYGLIPQTFAFLLMLVFTAFTTIAAINYNLQLIAHIGLVGAYAVPFLLSEGSGKVGILFSYMSIINIGILVIAFKKYWKALYYSSFVLSWLTYLLWFASAYETKEHFGLALGFLAVFFVIFYLTFLAYKLLQKEKFEIENIILLLANSFLFYGLGYAILDGHESGQQLLGIFTIANALIHFTVSVIFYKQKLADRNLFYLVSGLVLVFITIAIPVQLDGNWVTNLWAGEAALLFWIGRTKKVTVYENLSYLLMLLAFGSIVQDWMGFYYDYYSADSETKITPLLNIKFLSSVLFIAAFSIIYYLNQKYITVIASLEEVRKIFSHLIPAILLISIYFAFRLEIGLYWDQLLSQTAISIDSADQYPSYYWNWDLNEFKTVWIINYSLLFVSLLAFVNFKKLKNQFLGQLNLGLITFSIAVFLIQGLYALSELRESYLDPNRWEYFQKSVFSIGIRYVSFAFVAFALFACYKYIQQKFMQNKYKKAFDFLLYITLLWVFSSELIHWLDIARSDQSYKLGLSILWGVYSLLLIVLGIWKSKKHLRIGAIVLFAGTLVKLFLYDLTQLNTIGKTIVFVSLGVLLLIISFLYNKYKHLISDEVSD